MKKLTLILSLFPIAAACGGPLAPEESDSETKDALVIPIDAFPTLAPSLKLRFPISRKDRALMTQAPIVGMDHASASSANKTVCLDHDGLSFPFCYNDHDGTDFLLHGGFPQMDLHSP